MESAVALDPRLLPIRVRLALAFALIMALVLTGVGALVYERTRSDLDRQIDRELAARLAGAVAIVRDDGDDLGDPVQDPLGRVDAEGVVQVLSPSGDVADATASQLAGTPLVGAEALGSVLAGESVNVDVRGDLIDQRLRLVGAQTKDDGVRYVVLVGASLESRDDALASLARLLLIGGPIALLIATAAAYWVATAALRPVESMRRGAAEISDEDPGRRLPIPSARDEISDLGETLNQMLARLEGALARERRFVADASHELRTPLSILRAEVDLALEEGTDPVEPRAALLSVGEEADRLSQLAEDLLIVARADQGQLPIAQREVGVAELTERVVTRFAARERDRERLIVAYGGDAVVQGDPLRLEQALSNLVDNALRYGAGEVRLKARSAGDRLELHVVDRGAGFSQELLARAFDRFARADHPEARGGAGLGLAIVEAIAHAHGGSAHAANRQGGGADVWISLPAAAGVDGGTPSIP
jgi:signal transduction histidine kinase